ERIAGGAADVARHGAAAGCVGGGVVVGVVDREGDLRVRLLGVDERARVGGRRGGLVVPGVVVGAGVEAVGAVGGAAVAEAAVDAGAGVGVDLGERAAGRLRPQLDIGNARIGAILERVAVGVVDRDR